jgi:hypothetical protein
VSAQIALIGEARGEYLALELIAERIRETLGPDAVLHVQMDEKDLATAEQARTLVPATEPEFHDAMQIPIDELPARIAETEAAFNISNLRRLWQADLQFWRDGRPEHELARQAIGYIRVFDRLYDEHADLVGGYAEDSTRLVKRTFRAVSLHRGRRMVVALSFAYPNRVVLVDQEDLTHTRIDWEDFTPSPAELEVASTFLEQVRTSTLQFAEPRDLSMSTRRITNFFRLVWRTYAGSTPGDRNPFLLRYAAMDYLRQRMRLAAMRRLATARPNRSRAVFYPFHYATDSQVAIRGEAYRDQVAVVELIAKSLPYGYTLWVKPHPAFAGQVPLSGVRAMRNLGNVEVVHPSVHAHELLRRAAALITINSTTGFEALAFRVPVVTLGSSLYRGRGVTTDIANLDDLSASLRTAVHALPASDADVAQLIAYLVHISYEIPMLEGNHNTETTRKYGEALLEEFGLSARQPAGSM